MEWNKRIDSFLMKLSYNKCTSEHEVYVKGSIEQDQIILCLYVVDLLVTCSNKDELENLNAIMEN